MFAFPQPHYTACLSCGASVARGEALSHVCEPGQRLDHLLAQLLGELAHFEQEFVEYLESPRGRFEAWYAARRR
jgi:hypothetical protein